MSLSSLRWGKSDYTSSHSDNERDFFDRGIARLGLVEGTRASNGWHTDITFENLPSDYAVSNVYKLIAVGHSSSYRS